MNALADMSSCVTPDLEELEKHLNLGANSPFLPLMVEVELYKSGAFVPDHMVLCMRCD